MAATSRNHQQVLKHNIRLFSPPRKVEGVAGPPTEEFDEADVWCVQSASKPDKRSPVHRSQSAWKKIRTNVGFGSGSGSDSDSRLGSIPVNIPDWSKIMLHEYSSMNCYEELGFEEEEEEAIVPPHEVVMRRRAASLSVVEGIGRTLKGRDLSRVRNAIWAKTGFQD